MADSSWGPGWPNCQRDKIVAINVDGTTFPGGVRRELVELITRLVRETKNRGYAFGNPSNPSYGCWGFACRAIGNSNKPSNHSWGLALDINAPANPQKRPLTTNMPDWMPDLWNAYGFRWGGDYEFATPDAMHYEFVGTVADSQKFTDLAVQNNLGGSGQQPQPKPPEPPRPPTHQTFPLPAGHYFGPKSGPPSSHSGYYNNDDDKFRPWQAQMSARGWKIKVDGLYGPESESVARSFQAEKGLKVDGLIGKQTWDTAWTAPIT